MTKWKLPRLISNGMILQQKQKCRIWGWDVPGREITVSFLGENYRTHADECGRWKINLQEHAPGGPYVMKICDDAGNESVIENILIGDVWFCSGQSNMELPMERVKDAYPEEIVNCNHPFIRTFKITEHVNYHEPLEELTTGEWKTAGQETIKAFSATAYFFAKKLYQMTGVAVGLINASLGGSGIECWMGRDMLEGYEDLLSLADRYADDAFVENRKRKNEEQAQQWHTTLDSNDIGLKEGWEQQGAVWESDCAVTVPFFFRDTKLKDFVGCVWFKRTFHVPPQMAGKDAKLWLGTIVDSDRVFINGVEVGHTDYQYPPRKYEVCGKLLQPGDNTIVIRVKVEQGKGRFTIGKKYAIWNEAAEVDLTGIWQYRIGAVCTPPMPTDFISWKPTGLYHGMTAPCHNYNIAGVLWYQGETNAGEPEKYIDLFKRLVEGYRCKWGDENLPFYYVQLPNFTIDMDSDNPEEAGREWAKMRVAQKHSLCIPNTGMVTAIDLGEDNDLHPLNKKGIGERLALLAAAHMHGMDVEYTGPVAGQAILRRTGTGRSICISCDHAEGMYAANPEKTDELLDFELIDGNGKAFPVSASIEGEAIIVHCEEEAEPIMVRYCYKNSPDGGIIYNKEGLPMSPFVIEIDR